MLWTSLCPSFEGDVYDEYRASPIKEAKVHRPTCAGELHWSLERWKSCRFDESRIDLGKRMAKSLNIHIFVYFAVVHSWKHVEMRREISGYRPSLYTFCGDKGMDGVGVSRACKRQRKVLIQFKTKSRTPKDLNRRENISTVRWYWAYMSKREPRSDAMPYREGK